MMKTCTKCKNEVPIEKFGNHTHWCKVCMCEKSKQWYQENKEKKLLYDRDRRTGEKRDFILQQKRAEKKKNKDRYNAWTREYDRKRRATDIKYKLTGNMKTVIRRALRGKKNGRSWKQMVNYTVEELINHLETKFLPGMTWENYGEWHIDHIKPICAFTFTTPECKEFKECWALENLQPLWAEDNLAKGGDYCVHAGVS